MARMDMDWNLKKKTGQFLQRLKVSWNLHKFIMANQSPLFSFDIFLLPYFFD